MPYINCIKCGKEKYCRPYRLKLGKGKFCSVSCAMKGRIVSEKQREKISKSLEGHKGYWTGKKFSDEHLEKLRVASKKIGISEETREKMWQTRMAHREQWSEARKGSKCYLWKGGITPITQKIRHTLEYRKWRETIFERDNYTCQICKKRGGKLNADHYPVSFAEIFSGVNVPVESLYDTAMNVTLFWDTSNGRTLCEDCHRVTPTFGTRGLNNLKGRVGLIK